MFKNSVFRLKRKNMIGLIYILKLLVEGKHMFVKQNNAIYEKRTMYASSKTNNIRIQKI